MKVNNYDIIIVGGGIAGLYSAYKIQQFSKNAKILVLEKHKKKWFGGRLGNTIFHDVSVVNGAGVGRKNKDKLLIDLLDDLDVPYAEFNSTHQYASTISQPCDVKQVFNLLKKEYNKSKDREHITFKKFAKPLLGDKNYQNFLVCAGYTDYENEDAYDTLYNYGFEDNYTDWIALKINWKRLIETLAHAIGLENIRVSSNVVNIEKVSETPCEFLVHLENGKTFSCNKVIMATTITSVRNLVPGAKNKYSIYQQIHGQPFLRLYAKFSKASIPIMRTYVPTITIVPGPLHKIVPYDSNEGIYMIAYTDNDGARELKDHITNSPANRDFFCRLVEISLGMREDTLKITSMLDFYWPIGTHYYGPLSDEYSTRNEFIRKAQHPMRGMLVVGEMISENQGWTEGALESVEKVVTKKWVTTHC